MNYFARAFNACLVLLALSASILVASDEAQSATITITGSPFGQNGTGSFTGYGTSIGKNNVVNFAPSGLRDPTNLKPWVTQGNSGSSGVTSNVSNYEVDWYFNGAESGNTNKFFSSGSVTYTEHDLNNNYQNGNDAKWLLIGTSSGKGVDSFIPFTLTDTSLPGSPSVSNGANNKPSSNLGSLMFAYVNPIYSVTGILLSWKVTKTATDWFAFGLNDPGSTDRDFDDFMGVGHLRFVLEAPSTSPVPLPGAFLLMGTILASSCGVASWRRRRARTAA